MIHSKKDIIRLAAQEAGISKEQMSIMVEDMEEALVFFVKNPLLAGINISVNMGKKILFSFYALPNFINNRYRKYKKYYATSKHTMYIKQYKEKYEI